MISKFSVKKPYTVLVGVVLAIVLGVVSFTKMTADLLPDINLPYIIVMTTYPGASPETVETVVTQPVEAAMATVSNIEGIQSVSNENYSMVILEFAQTTNMDSISLEIRESLDQIKGYWDDSIGNPIMIKLNPNMLPVMIAAVGIKGMDNAEISDYVENTVAPDLESVEGVASVSAIGLLEESVNVIIRQEKVDAINEQVFAAIDEKMADAEKELADGKQGILDGQKEIDKAKTELVNGQNKLNDGKTELNKGKDELNKGKDELTNKQNSTAAMLAEQKTALLSAKTQLEKTKADLDMAKRYDDTIKQIELLTPLQNCGDQYLKLDASFNPVSGYVVDLGAAGAILAINPTDSTAIANYTTAVTNIQTLKNNFVNNPAIVWLAGIDPTIGSILNVDELAALDWTDVTNQTTITKVSTALMAVQMAYPKLDEQKNNTNIALRAITGGLDYNSYVATINTVLASQKITDIDKAIADLNKGLVELEKGEITAAIEFANGKATIALGEYQMQVAEKELESAQAQLDSGKDQLKDGEQQLKDALSQLEDGEKQLADAKEEAYKSADMTGILTVETISGLLTAQNFSMPAGYVTEDGVSYLVRVGDKPSTVEELQALPLLDLHMDGVDVITLGDVADVFYTDNSESIYTNVNGDPGVMLSIQKQTGYSTGEVSDSLLDKFDELMEENENLSMITLMDQGVYIDIVMDSIINNILVGAVLAIIILILFLKDIRPTLIIAFSIPISLVTAIVCMYFSGVTLNVISLSGLALGIGMLVDNSIVVIENIYRLRNEGYSMKDAAIEGSKEVAGAIMASTLTTVCVFLPIVFTTGITKQLFVDMGLTIGYSLLASLVIALTVVPAMSSKMLTKTKAAKESKFFNVLIGGYEKVLKGSLAVKPLVFIMAIVLLVLSFVAAASNGTAFMADMDSTQLSVNVKLADEATLAETGEITDQVVEKIMEIEDIVDVGAMTSTSTMSLLAGGGSGGKTNAASIYVVSSEDKKLSNDEIAAIILDKTKDLDAEITVDTSSMDMSALGGSGVTIQIRGREIDKLQEIAIDVASKLEQVEGVMNVNNGLGETDEELRIIVDRNKAVSYGLTVAQVFQQVYTKLADAKTATTLISESKDYNVYVMSGNDIELTRELVKDLEIDGTDADKKAVKVKLSEVADFQTTQAMKSINRVDQTRYISVSAAIADGYNVGLVSRDIEKVFNNYDLPSGYKLVFTGENETINDALGQMLLMLLLAVIFMYLIMVAQFQSLLSPFIIMFTIPLAFTGGFFGLFFSGSEISVIALIGFVMLSGIIVNNGIVLIDYMNQLREEGMDRKEAIITAGKTRLRPVLMTALTTILALSTMVFSNNMGSEMAKPMSIVTIGGLIYGTLLTLVVIPCVYDVFMTGVDKRRAKREAKLAVNEDAHWDFEDEDEEVNE